jgi:hypothetical protein
MFMYVMIGAYTGCGNWDILIAIFELVLGISVQPSCKKWFRFHPLPSHKFVMGKKFFLFFLITFYLQAVQIHSTNGVKLLEA